MYATVTEIVGALMIGIGVGAVLGPLLGRFFRNRWLPNRQSDHAAADQALKTANELRFKLRVEDTARREILHAEGRVKGSEE